jgi:hypothetical protein
LTVVLNHDPTNYQKNSGVSEVFSGTFHGIIAHIGRYLNILAEIYKSKRKRIMKNKLTQITLGTFVIAIAIFGGSQLLVSGQEKGRSHLRDLVGTWQTSVTPRDCATGLPIPIPPFPGILTFNQGGTMTGTSSAVSSTFGIWRAERGWSEYSFKSVSFRYDPAGTILGTRTIMQHVTLEEEGVAFNSTGAFEDADLNGGIVAIGCTTATGSRLE